MFGTALQKPRFDFKYGGGKKKKNVVKAHKTLIDIVSLKNDIKNKQDLIEMDFFENFRSANFRKDFFLHLF